ncbi:MAG: hypothetical protein EOO74_07320, partial [Myxococcales bacterium]
MPALAALLLVVFLAACGGPDKPQAKKSDSPPSSPSTSASAKKLKDLDQPLLSSDLLVLSTDTIPGTVVDDVRGLPGVTHVEKLALGQFFSEEVGVTYAAVDPASFRRLTPPGTAQTTDVWNRVANGEMAINPTLGKELQSKSGYVRVGAGKEAPQVHIGALANLTDPAIAPMTR